MTTAELVTATPTDSPFALATRELEPETALQLRSTFGKMLDDAQAWAERARSIRVTSSDQVREMKLARETRLALRDIRTNAERVRKAAKEDVNRRGKAIDGLANVIKALTEPLEEHLREQETFAEREEAAKRDALRSAREEALRAYGVDPSTFANLGATTEEAWGSILETAKIAAEAREAAKREAELVRLEAERIAAERAAAKRAEAARIEAERVAELAAAREAERLAVAAKVAAVEAAAIEAARVERETRAERAQLEEARKVERAQLEEARAAKEAAEREAVHLANVERDRLALEAHNARLTEREAERAALAPDQKKLAAYAGRLSAVPVAGCTTERGRALEEKVQVQIARVVAWIERETRAM